MVSNYNALLSLLTYMFQRFLMQLQTNIYFSLLTIHLNFNILVPAEFHTYSFTFKSVCLPLSFSLSLKLICILRHTHRERERERERDSYLWEWYFGLIFFVKTLLSKNTPKNTQNCAIHNFVNTMDKTKNNKKKQLKQMHKLKLYFLE